jgi:hypothetical protein
MAVLSVAWLAVAVLQKGVEGQPVTSLWGGYGDPLAWLVLLWPAVGQYSSGEISAVAAQSRRVQHSLTLVTDVLLRVAAHVFSALNPCS